MPVRGAGALWSSSPLHRGASSSVTGTGRPHFHAGLNLVFHRHRSSLLCIAYEPGTSPANSQEKICAGLVIFPVLKTLFIYGGVGSSDKRLCRRERRVP